MTRDQILSLTGPALSEAVAEHVMRWKRLSMAPVVENRVSTWTDARKNWYLIPHGPPLRPGDAGLFGIVAEVWEPHQDMRAAWQVFGAAPGDKKTLRIWDNRFYAVIDDGELVEADSSATAICRASLFTILTHSPQPQVSK